MTVGMIGRKVGMMRLFDGAGRSRGVTVIEFDPNYVTQIRSEDRDGYAAVQVGARGTSKHMTRPERGHLRAAGLEDEPLGELHEFRIAEAEGYATGQALSVDQFEPGAYVNVTGVTKGRGFAGVVRRWNFAGGPKTHGQSDRHRAPGSIGAGTDPGRVWKGQKMGGHMGARRKTVLNLLVVQSDAARNLLFVEGAVPGPNGAIVTVTDGRRAPLADFDPPVLPPFEGDGPAPVAEDAAPPEVVDEDAPDAAADDAPAADDPAEAEGAAEAEAAADEEAADEADQADDAESAEGEEEQS
jgi:large subunit ribosomal protein L3